MTQPSHERVCNVPVTTGELPLPGEGAAGPERTDRSGRAEHDAGWIRAARRARTLSWFSLAQGVEAWQGEDCG